MARIKQRPAARQPAINLEDQDDELESSPQDVDRRRDPDLLLQQRAMESNNRFQSTMASIFEKYGRDFGDDADEIDLRTGEVVVDRGHLAGLQEEEEEEEEEDNDGGAGGTDLDGEFTTEEEEDNSESENSREESASDGERGGKGPKAHMKDHIFEAWAEANKAHGDLNFMGDMGEPNQPHEQSWQDHRDDQEEDRRRDVQSSLARTLNPDYMSLPPAYDSGPLQMPPGDFSVMDFAFDGPSCRGGPPPVGYPREYPDSYPPPFYPPPRKWPRGARTEPSGTRTKPPGTRTKRLSSKFPRDQESPKRVSSAPAEASESRPPRSDTGEAKKRIQKLKQQAKKKRDAIITGRKDKDLEAGQADNTSKEVVSEPKSSPGKSLAQPPARGRGRPRKSLQVETPGLSEAVFGGDKETHSAYGDSGTEEEMHQITETSFDGSSPSDRRRSGRARKQTDFLGLTCWYKPSKPQIVVVIPRSPRNREEYQIIDVQSVDGDASEKTSVDDTENQRTQEIPTITTPMSVESSAQQLSVVPDSQESSTAPKSSASHVVQQVVEELPVPSYNYDRDDCSSGFSDDALPILLKPSRLGSTSAKAPVVDVAIIEEVQEQRVVETVTSIDEDVLNEEEIVDSQDKAEQKDGQVPSSIPIEVGEADPEESTVLVGLTTPYQAPIEDLVVEELGTPPTIDVTLSAIQDVKILEGRIATGDYDGGTHIYPSLREEPQLNVVDDGLVDNGHVANDLVLVTQDAGATEVISGTIPNSTDETPSPIIRQTATPTRSAQHQASQDSPSIKKSVANPVNSSKKTNRVLTPSITNSPQTPRHSHIRLREPSSRRSILSLLSDDEADDLSRENTSLQSLGIVSPFLNGIKTSTDRTSTPSRRARIQSASISKKLWRRSALMQTPTKKRKGREDGGDGDLILTPGGTKRRCGVADFVCGRDFCFSCLA